LKEISYGVEYITLKITHSNEGFEFYSRLKCLGYLKNYTMSLSSELMRISDEIKVIINLVKRR